MANGEYYESVNRYAVRIAVNIQENLKGSGVILLRHLGESPLLLTAAHVVSPLFQNTDTVTLCLGCMDGDNQVQIIELKAYLVRDKEQGNDKEGETYIHPEYSEKGELKKEYSHDAAIVVLPWKEWMETLDGFLLKDETIGETLAGWGFPSSTDNEIKVASADILAGKKRIYGTVDNRVSNVKRFSFSYSAGTWERNVTRDSFMIGFSGSGLFEIQKNSIAFKGLISCEYGEKSAGTMLWASSSCLFIELMEYYKLEIKCPRSFQCYKEKIVQNIFRTRKEAKILFTDWAEELIEDHQLYPENFDADTQIELPCVSNRRSCDDFWMGQLKKSVLLYGIKGIPADKLVRPLLQMPEPYEKDTVEIVFLCTEENAESVIGDLIEKDYFTEKGTIRNGTIFVLNNKCSNRRVVIPRYECREVIRNIVSDYDSSRKLKKKTYHLLPDCEEDGNFDIIRGKVSQCDLAAIGIDEIMTLLDRGRIKREDLSREMEDILKGVWEI